MSDKVKEFIQELNKRRAAVTEESLQRLTRDFARKDRKPPGVFEDSSFLYIRSHDADQGVRPFSNIVFWHSPDITLAPASNPQAYTTELQAGETYTIRIVLRNRGDLAVPSAKVELFMVDPSIGFDTRVATRLTNLTNMPAAWVNSNATTTVEFPYTVSPAEAGHKCLFARCFSFSPLDVPFDDFQLDPRLDRHVAQQNLNIVAQGQAFEFLVFHMPAAQMLIEFVPMTAADIFGLRHPILGDVKPFDDIPRRDLARLTGLAIVKEAGQVSLDPAGNGATLIARSRDGTSIDEQIRFRTEVRNLLDAVASGETTLSKHHRFLAAFREMNKAVGATRMRMRAPELGLRQGQVAAFRIRGLDMAFDRGDPVGGLTLLVVA